MKNPILLFLLIFLASDIHSTTEDNAPLKLDQFETISVDFPDEKVVRILRNVADLFELNLVIPHELTESEKRTHFKLRDVTWQTVFDVTLTPIGYYWFKDDNIIRIISIEEYKDYYTEENIRLNQIEYKDIEPLIEILQDDRLIRDVSFSSDSKILTYRTLISLSFSFTHIIEQMDKSNLRVTNKSSNKSE